MELGPGEEDGLRARVEVLVQGYIERVFDGAKSGVRVNGMDVGESEGLMSGEGERDLRLELELEANRFCCRGGGV